MLSQFLVNVVEFSVFFIPNDSHRHIVFIKHILVRSIVVMHLVDIINILCRYHVSVVTVV